MLNNQLFADSLDDVLSKAGVDAENQKRTLHEIAQSYRLNLVGLKKLSQATVMAPAITPPSCVHRVHMPYLNFSVNAWIYECGKEVILIDTGAEATAIIERLETQGLTPTRLLITHAHPDHTGGLEAIMATFPHLTPIDCRAIPTGGHIQRHDSFYFAEDQVCFVGDALFAGSMGNPNVCETRSRQSVQDILALPPETILLSGHGPATTVARERKYNCFSTGYDS